MVKSIEREKKKIIFVFLLFICISLFQNCGQFQRVQSSTKSLNTSGFSRVDELRGRESNGTSLSPHDQTVSDQNSLFSLPMGNGTPLEPTLDSMQWTCGVSGERMRQIHSLLQEVMGDGGSWHLIESASASSNYPGVLYDLQELTANILKASENCKDVFIMDQLAKLYTIPFSFLKLDPEGNSVWPGEYDGREVLLYSTQFMYAVAKLVNIIAKTPRSRWTSAMNTFMYGPRGILKAHLMRWVRKGSFSNCFGHDRRYTLAEYSVLKKNRSLGPHSYCNAIGEGEMWVAAAGIELLSANDWVGLSDIDVRDLQNSIRVAVDLFESRLSVRDACPGGACHGLLLDVGGWKGHPEYHADLWPVGGETWDFSHMRRIVQWVDAFYLHLDISGAKYSSYEGIVALLSNELYYQVFNQSFINPGFTNFWNGWNVSYRGLGDYQYSASYFRAGYGFWGAYRSEIASINSALLHLIDSHKGSTYMTPNGIPPSGDIDVLNFLASLTKPD